MNRLLIYLSLLALSVGAAKAQTDADRISYPDYQEDVFMDMDLPQNIVTPEIPVHAQAAIINHQRKLANRLKHKYTVDLMHNDAVFVVCLPTDDLFLPNDTLLTDNASSVLNPLLDLMKDPYMYKILLAVHTDDTGSENYRQDLSTARIYSIYDWMLDAIDRGRISEDLVIIPYSMGSSEPIVKNDTRKHRKENRRLEIYFVPGPKMISLAKERKLK